jgi:DNA polymerase I-like protein with 3'-5' exonuclease and polymerase domains
MSMEELDEFLLPAGETLLAAYVSHALENPLRIPVSEPVVEERWDKKAARRVEHLKKPVRLKTKLTKMVTASMSGKKSYRDSFKALHEQEIKALAGVFGPVPEATIADVPYDSALWYSCRDADATIRIYNLLNPLIDQMGLRFILDYIDLPILPIALEMQRNGLPSNPEVFQSLTREIRARMDFLETRLHYLAGEALHKPNPHVFNPNSTMQRAQIFYGSRADGFLGLKPTRYTEGGAPSTTTTELKKIVHPEAQPLIEPLCEYIEDLKLLSTYTAPLAKLAESGRIRYSIRTTRTATGRLSTHDPNVMSIPVRSELGRRVRSGFEAPDGWLLVAGDYCLAEGTMVETPYGHRAIENLCPGDLVYGYRDSRPNVTKVVAKSFSGLSKCLEITLDNGESFVCTPEHKVPVVSSGDKWDTRYAAQLSAGDRLLPFRRSFAGNYTTLYSHSNRNYSYEHTAVAEAVYGPRPDDHEVNHINHARTDNRPENLEYMHRSAHRSQDSKYSYANMNHSLRLENLRIGIKNRRSFVGEGNPNYGRRKGQEVECLFCGCVFYRPPVRAAKYCSVDCYTSARSSGLNHKVISVKQAGVLPVWDIQVEEPTHIFALACGVYTSNSQIEMRVAAHVTNCKSMIEIMNQGRDIHTETTLAIFGVSLEQAKDPKFRTPTKILNFGVMYGMTSRGLLDALREAGMDNWNTAMADEFIEDYFSLRPEIKTWQSALLSEATRKGYVSDMFGRIRRVPELRSPIRRVKAEGERNTVNMPIQSGAQGIIKRAMTNIWSRYYPAWNDFARWLLQVHDELIFEVREDMVAVVEAAFSYEMANAIKLSVPLEISVHHGKNWMELK